MIRSLLAVKVRGIHKLVCYTERPVRSFELLSDITASWNIDKLVNMFVLKVTRLEPLLSRSVRSLISSGLDVLNTCSDSRLFLTARQRMEAGYSGKASVVNGTSAGCS